MNNITKKFAKLENDLNKVWDLMCEIEEEFPNECDRPNFMVDEPVSHNTPASISKRFDRIKSAIFNNAYFVSDKILEEYQNSLEDNTSTVSTRDSVTVLPVVKVI
jgi:hypothetical protein